MEGWGLQSSRGEALPKHPFSIEREMRFGRHGECPVSLSKGHEEPRNPAQWMRPRIVQSAGNEGNLKKPSINILRR